MNVAVMAGCAIEEPILNPYSQESRIRVERNSPILHLKVKVKLVQMHNKKSIALWLAVTVD
jgi:hypothetical protein